MVKVAKKLFTVSVVTMTILWSVGIAALVPAYAQAEVECPDLQAGDLWKVDDANLPAVYVLNADMERMFFPNGEVFHTWYKDFSGVQSIPKSCVSLYPQPSTFPIGVNYRPGSMLVKVQIENPVYAVLPGNVYSHVSGDYAAALYGSNWASQVRDVNDAYWPNYTTAGAALDTAVPHDGMLVTIDGTTVYHVVDGMLYEVDGEVLGGVQTISNTVFGSLEIGTGTVTAGSVVADPTQLGDTPSTPGDDETPATGGDLMVSLSANTADATLIPLKAVAAPFLTVNLKAGDKAVSVTGLTLERTGLGSYSNFEKVWVEVDGVRKGTLKTMNSNNQVGLVFGTDPVELAAGESKAFVVYANMDDDYSTAPSGATNALKLTAVTSNGNVSGLPVSGNTMTFASVVAPTVSYDDASVGSSVSIGDENVSVAKVKVTNTNTSEDIHVKGFVLKSIAPTSGTRIDSDDVVDYELYKGTAKVAGPVQMASNNYLTFTLDEPVLIEKGGSKYETFTVKADIADGPGRYIKLDVENTSDVVVTGDNNGFRTYNSSVTYAAQEVQIGASDLILTTDAINNPAARNVLKNTTQTLLKGYINASKGEVNISAFRVTLTGNDMDFGTTDEYANLRVYVDGVLVGEATDSDISSSDGQTSIDVGFTDEFTVNGKKSLEVTVDVKDITDTDWIYASASGASGWSATRVADNASLTPGGSATGNKVTINQPALTVVLSGTPVSVTRVKGSVTDLLGFTVAAGVADDVTVTSLTFEMDSTGDYHDDPDLTNVYLMSSTGVELAGPFNFNSSNQVELSGLNLTIPAGDTVKYVLKGTLAASFSSASLADLWLKAADIDAADSQGTDIASVTGVDSGAINSAGTVKLTVVDRGTLDVALSNSTAKTHQVVANTTNDASAKVTLYSEYEDVLVKSFVFTTVGTTANDDDIKKVTLKYGDTILGSTEAISAGVVTFNLAEPYLKVPADTNLTLDLYTDYNSTVNSVADSGATVQWSIADFSTDIEADGALNDIYAGVESSSGTGVTLTSGATTTLNGGITTTTTSVVLTSATNVDVGNLILVDSEYMLVLAKSSNTLTVRRGAAGSTGVAHLTGATATEYTQTLKANTSLVYANRPTLGYSASAQAAGTLAVDTFEVLKFNLTDQSAGEEDVRLEELKVTVIGSGMATSGGDGWYITAAYLYNGNDLVGSTTTDVTASGGTITFAGLDSDADSVLTTASTFIVKVQVAEGSGGTITAGDTLRVYINTLGSANAAGAVSVGDLDWEDQEAPTTQVEWVDTTETDVRGGLYQKLT